MLETIQLAQHAHETVDDKDTGYLAALEAGQDYADKLAPELDEFGISPDLTALLDIIEDKTTRDAAEAFLFSSEMVKLHKFHEANGASSHARNDINYDYVTRFNHAIRRLILRADKTSLDSQDLAANITAYAEHRQLLPDHNASQDYQEEIISVIRGMRAEQDLINCLRTANVKNFDATADEDRLNGVDVLVKRRASDEWYGIDVKNSYTSILKSAAEDYGADARVIMEFSTQEQKRLCSLDRLTRGSHDSPVIHVLPYRGKFLLSIDFGRPTDTKPLAARKFGPGDDEILSLIKETKGYMDYVSSLTGDNYAGRRRITAYHREQDRFVPDYARAKPGRVAVRHQIAYQY